MYFIRQSITYKWYGLFLTGKLLAVLFAVEMVLIMECHTRILDFLLLLCVTVLNPESLFLAGVGGLVQWSGGVQTTIPIPDGIAWLCRPYSVFQESAVQEWLVINSKIKIHSSLSCVSTILSLDFAKQWMFIGELLGLSQRERIVWGLLQTILWARACFFLIGLCHFPKHKCW